MAELARQSSREAYRLRAIPITPAYLWAFHLRRPNADLVEPRERRRRLAVDLARYTRRHTSFVVTLRFGGPQPLTAGDAAMDLRAWRFRLLDRRGVARAPVTVQPYESARETESERAGLLSTEQRVVFRHVVRGALRFRYRIRARPGRLVLEATPPVDAMRPLRVEWVVGT